MNEQPTMPLPVEPVQSQSEQTDAEALAPTMEQQRAAFALAMVKQQMPAQGGSATSQKQAQEYRRVIQGLPAMVLTNGLGQALAFLISDPNSVAKQAVVRDLTDALTTIRGLYTNQPDELSLVERIVNGNREMLRQATDETLALLTWWVKFVRAFLPGPEGDS
jgi:CRISPR-associated protein Cmr5